MYETLPRVLSRTYVTSCDRVGAPEAIARARAALDARVARDAIVVIGDAALVPGGLGDGAVRVRSAVDVAGSHAALLGASLSPAALADALLPFALTAVGLPALGVPGDVGVASTIDADLVVAARSGGGVAASGADALALLSWWCGEAAAGRAVDPRAVPVDVAHVSEADVVAAETVAADETLRLWAWVGKYDQLFDGTPMTPRLRDLFAEGRARGELTAAPFDHAGFDAFAEWLAETDAPGVGRLLARIWAERADLKQAFPDLNQPEQRAGLLHWAEENGQAEESIPSWLLSYVPVDANAALGGLRADRRLVVEPRLGSLELGAALATDRERRLERRVAELEQQLAPLAEGARTLPWMQDDLLEPQDHPILGRVLGYRDAVSVADGEGYRRFEDVFRGTRERVRGLLAEYVPLLAEHAPVLDLGAGRGELLELLRDAGVAAHGVDNDAGMVAAARERSVEVTDADLNDHLLQQAPGALGAVTAIHVVEHLPYQQLVALLANARRALRPGGILVCETINPHAPFALKTFWVDPTHQHPLFPEVLLVLAQAAGFGEGCITHPRGTRDAAADWLRHDAYALVATA
jgi:SAM-dependent methyltransferase